MRTAIYAIGILVGALVIGALLVDEGEVVTLTTHDSGGGSFETQLWIVQIDSESYLRANSPRSDWLERARHDPAVELRRGEEVGSWQVTPQGDPELRRRVNQAMAEKYHLSDRLVTLLFDSEAMVPVRLEPVEGEVAGDRHGR